MSTRENLANSEGCTPTGPTDNQERFPLPASSPTNRVATSMRPTTTQTIPAVLRRNSSLNLPKTNPAMMPMARKPSCRLAK